MFRLAKSGLSTFHLLRLSHRLRRDCTYHSYVHGGFTGLLHQQNNSLRRGLPHSEYADHIFGRFGLSYDSHSVWIMGIGMGLVKFVRGVIDVQKHYRLDLLLLVFFHRDICDSQMSMAVKKEGNKLSLRKIY